MVRCPTRKWVCDVSLFTNRTSASPLASGTSGDFQLRHLAFLPVAEDSCSIDEHVVLFEIARDAENDAVRMDGPLVKGDQIVPGDALNRLDRAFASGGMFLTVQLFDETRGSRSTRDCLAGV